MPLISQNSLIPDTVKHSVLCIGKFDGVHRGHQALAAQAVALAGKLGTKAIAVTFDPPPVQILNPSLPIRPPITPTDRKIKLLKEFGFAEVTVFETGHWLLDLSARDFFDTIIVQKFSAAGVVEGPNFQFGKNRGGGVQELADWCAESGIVFEQAAPVEEQGGWVTSSRVVHEIRSGNIKTATELLGHGFETIGTVVRGAGRGRTINVPTANLDNCDTILPAPGVYAAVASIADASGAFGKQYPAAVNIGAQPTFASEIERLEAHLIGLTNADLYGCQVKLQWVDRIRETMKFTSVEELIRQIAIDIETCRRICNDFN